MLLGTQLRLYRAQTANIGIYCVIFVSPILPSSYILLEKTCHQIAFSNRFKVGALTNVRFFDRGGLCKTGVFCPSYEANGALSQFYPMILYAFFRPVPQVISYYEGAALNTSLPLA